VQPVFATVKLRVLYVAGNLAWAVVLRAAARQRQGAFTPG
jgi:hypothetical protein